MQDAEYDAHVMHGEKERERDREDGCGDSNSLLLGLGVAAMFAQLRVRCETMARINCSLVLALTLRHCVWTGGNRTGKEELIPGHDNLHVLAHQNTGRIDSYTKHLI